MKKINYLISSIFFTIFCFNLTQAQTLERELNQNIDRNRYELKKRQEVQKFIYENSISYYCQPDFLDQNAQLILNRDVYYFYIPPPSIPELYPKILSKNNVFKIKLEKAISLSDSQKKEYAKFHQERFQKKVDSYKSEGKNPNHFMILSEVSKDTAFDVLYIKFIRENQIALVGVKIPDIEADSRYAGVIPPTFKISDNYYIWNGDNWYDDGSSNPTLNAKYEFKLSSSTLFAKIDNTPIQERQCRRIK